MGFNVASRTRCSIARIAMLGSVWTRNLPKPTPPALTCILGKRGGRDVGQMLMLGDRLDLVLLQPAKGYAVFPGDVHRCTPGKPWLAARRNAQRFRRLED
jgi:hypothetical protein